MWGTSARYWQSQRSHLLCPSRRRTQSACQPGAAGNMHARSRPCTASSEAAGSMQGGNDACDGARSGAQLLYVQLAHPFPACTCRSCFGLHQSFSGNACTGRTHAVGCCSCQLLPSSLRNPPPSRDPCLHCASSCNSPGPRPVTAYPAPARPCSRGKASHRTPETPTRIPRCSTAAPAVPSANSAAAQRVTSSAAAHSAASAGRHDARQPL